MKFRSLYILLLFFITLVFIQSCSSTRYVPDGEYWLENASVKSDNRRISSLDMEPYIRQKGNFKTFTVFRLPLFIYNLSGSDTTKWVNRALRSGGEPPVIYDSTLVEKTVTDLKQVLSNKGYVHAEITPQVTYAEKKVDVTYQLKTGDPYRISNYTINISDTVFSNEAYERFSMRNRNTKDSLTTEINQFLLRNTLVKKNSIFDLEMLDDERERIASLFRNFGYYYFNKEYIGFIADTLAGNNLVDLELTVYPFMYKDVNGEIKTQEHRQYVVKDISVYVDYNPLEDGDLSDYLATDTIYRNNGEYKIYYGKRGNYIKPHVILNSCYITPSALYNERATTTTYNSLSQLHILRNINIRYEEFIENDSTKLRCIITCVPDKKQAILTEIEGTNSGKGQFGVGASIGYSHRNAFRGSELFNAKIYGSYEAISANFSNFDKNYFEIGGEVSLNFPRFMFPFLNRETRRRLRASTELNANYIYQRRPDYFTRTILASGLKYNWQSRRNSFARHTLDLIDISYIHIPTLDEAFEKKLTEAARVYSFSDQFVHSIGYTYSNTNFNIFSRKMQSIYSLRASFETAGNLLSVVAKLANAEEDEIGSRKIFGTRFSQYARGNFDYSKSIPIDERNSIAWRLGGGVVYPYGNNKLVPIQKRFFSGGANSVRGWAVRELGPGSYYDKDATFYDHSGNIRFDANVEYRSKAFWILEFAAFLDAGNIWTVKGSEEDKRNSVFKPNRFYKEIALAWGLGIRFDFDFVLVRLDCGWKLYDPANVPRHDYLESDPSTWKYQSKWKVTDPLNIRENTAWHIAVGYPF